MAFWDFLKANNKDAGFTQPQQPSEEDKRLIGVMNHFKNTFSYETGIEWQAVEKAASWPEGREIANLLKELENGIRKHGRIKAYPAIFKKLTKLMNSVMPNSSQPSSHQPVTTSQPMPVATNQPPPPLTAAWQQMQTQAPQMQTQAPQMQTQAPQGLDQQIQNKLQLIDQKLAALAAKEKQLDELIKRLSKTGSF